MNPVEIEMNFPAEHGGNVFGQFDAYMKKIEKTLHVSLILRGDHLKCIGTQQAVNHAISVIDELLELSKRGNVITEQNVNYALSLSMEEKSPSLLELDKDVICHTIQGKAVKPKTLGQQKYVDAIKNKMITFGVGPAGTGKTYLAMAMAITAFKNDEVSRIILTRPAIEAGEKLGFLPGDLQSKVDPYLRPLYDALFDMLGGERVNKFLERGTIEVAPLAFMRGRTLDNAFIILDEAQNTTREQMKMFLTRLGFGSKAVVTGDLTQTDLPDNKKSGLLHARDVLKGVEGIGSINLTERDVVRHALVQRIIVAYDKYDKKQEEIKTKHKEKNTKKK